MKKKNFLILIGVLFIVVIGLIVGLLLKGESAPGEKISEELRIAKENFRIELNINKDEYYIYGLKKTKNVSGANIIIPDSVDGIPVTKIIDKETSFSSFNNVSIITLGKNVNYIGTNGYSDNKYGESIFSGATALTYIDVNPENETFVSVDGVLYSKDKTVLIKYPANKTKSVNQNVHSYTILDTVEVIYQKAFYYNSSIEVVYISDSVTTIEEQSFSGCINLHKISFGKKVSKIGKETFMYCKNLDTVELPESLEKLLYGAFKGCSKLVDITFNSIVNEIGKSIFTGCSSLSSIYVREEHMQRYIELFSENDLQKDLDKIKTIK